MRDKKSLFERVAVIIFDQSIEGQRLAREALQKRHLDILAGE